MKKETINAFTGDGSAAYAMKQIKPEVVAAYPITPQTQIIEDFSYYIKKNDLNCEIILTESEHSAMSACVGSSAAGARTITASASQGILLMAEILPIASSLRLPIVMNVVNRAISAPINIHGDHSDSMFVKDSGWIQIFSENPQEVYDHNLLAIKLAESKEVLLPVMIMQDGFVTSHSFEKVNVLLDKEVEKYIGEFQPAYSILDQKNPITIGPLQLFDNYFETKHQQHKVSIDKVKKEFIKVGEELEKLTNRKYFFFDQYQSKDADYIIVCTSSTAGTAKVVVDKLRKQKLKVGLVKIRLFRPFPHEELRSALKNAKSIAVLDRSFAYGSIPPLYSDVLASIHNTNIKAQSYVFGLGGRDIFEKDIVKVFEDLINDKINKEVSYEKDIKFIGLRE